MTFNAINDRFGLNSVPEQPKPQVQPAQVNKVAIQDTWVSAVGQMVTMLKSKSDFGQVSDVLFRIPVLINGKVEVWEYNTMLERDINVQNFQQHVINIADSICKWNLASQIYNEIIELKQMEYDNWKAKSMYIIRQQNSNDKKVTEAALRELYTMSNEQIDTPKRLELLYLTGTKNVIDNAIIKSLNEKSKHLVTIGLQYRTEFKGNLTIQ